MSPIRQTQKTVKFNQVNQSTKSIKKNLFQTQQSYTSRNNEEYGNSSPLKMAAAL